MKNISKKVNDFFETFCSPALFRIRKIVYLSFELLSLIGCLILFFLPICIVPISNEAGEFINYSITAFSVFKTMSSNVTGLVSFTFLQMSVFVFIALFVCIIIYKIIRTLLYRSDEDISKLTKSAITHSTVSILCFTFVAYFFSPVNIMFGGYSLSSVKIGVVLYIAIVYLLYAILSGIIIWVRIKHEDADASFKRKSEAERKKLLRTLWFHQLELVIFSLACAVIAFISMLSDIVTVTFDVPGLDIPNLVISGKNLLFNSGELTMANERTLSFILFVLFAATVISIFFSAVSLLSRSSLCSKVSLISIIVYNS